MGLIQRIVRKLLEGKPGGGTRKKRT